MSYLTSYLVYRGLRDGVRDHRRTKIRVQALSNLLGQEVGTKWTVSGTKKPVLDYEVIRRLMLLHAKSIDHPEGDFYSRYLLFLECLTDEGRSSVVRQLLAASNALKSQLGQPYPLWADLNDLDGYLDFLQTEFCRYSAFVLARKAAEANASAPH